MLIRVNLDASWPVFPFLLTALPAVAIKASDAEEKSDWLLFCFFLQYNCRNEIASTSHWDSWWNDEVRSRIEPGEWTDNTIWKKTRECCYRTYRWNIGIHHKATSRKRGRLLSKLFQRSTPKDYKYSKKIELPFLHFAVLVKTKILPVRSVERTMCKWVTTQVSLPQPNPNAGHVGCRVCTCTQKNFTSLPLLRPSHLLSAVQYTAELFTTLKKRWCCGKTWY